MINRIQHNFILAIIFSFLLILKIVLLEDYSLNDLFHSGFNQIFGIATYLLLLILLIAQYTQLINSYQFFDRRIYSLLFILPLLLSLGEVSEEAINYLILNNVILLVLFHLFKIKKGIETRSIPFNTGLIIGGVSIIYSPFIFATFLVVAGLTSLRVSTIREFLAIVFGLLLPSLVFMSVNYLFDNNINAFGSMSSEWMSLQVGELIYYSVLLLTILICVPASLLRLSQGSIFEKTSLYIFITLSVVMFGIFLVSEKLVLFPIIMLVPFSFFIINFLFYSKTRYLKWGVIVLLLLLSMARSIF